MKRLMMLGLCLALVALAYGDAGAHGETHTKLMGTIRTVAETELLVIDRNEKEHMVALGSATRCVTMSGAAASCNDLQAGVRVVVTLESHGHVAKEVLFAVGAEASHEDGHDQGEVHDHAGGEHSH